MKKYTYNYDVDIVGDYRIGHGIVQATSPREAVAKALIKMFDDNIHCLDLSKCNPDEFELIDVDTEKDTTPVPDGAEFWSGPWVATEQYVREELAYGNELKLEGAEILTVDGWYLRESVKVYFFTSDPVTKI